MMKKLILGAAAAVATLAAGGADMAQPYGYHRDYTGYGYGYDRSYGYDRGSGYDRGADYGRGSDYRYRDRDHDGVPDRWDRYDNRYERHEGRRHHHHHEWRERYDRDWRW